MSSAASQPIIFHYEESIYAHKVLWYLALRGISYSECIVLNRLPREQLTNLGINYRRIPLVAIGRDVYADTRLIIEKLESFYPPSLTSASLTPPDEHGAGLAKIYQTWNNDGGVFWRAVSLLPAWKAWQMNDKKWLADRKEMTGLELSEELMSKGRPEGLAHMRIAFSTTEHGVLADGRKWILGGKSPTIADIEAVYPFEWLIEEPLMDGALPAGGVITKDKFPLTWAWVERFVEAVKEGKKKLKITTLRDEETAQKILNAALVEKNYDVDEEDPLGLKKGQLVEVFPADNASYKKDSGKLVGLSKDEIVIENEKTIRLHFPRWNFRIVPLQATTAANEPVLPSMRYFYHPLSPYSRKAYMMAIEAGLESRIKLDKVVVAPVTVEGWSDGVETVSPFNPLAKLPTLVPDDEQEGIFDSRTICDYLEAHAIKKSIINEKLKWRLRTLAAAADGIFDAQVLIIYETNIRPDEVQYQKWIEGQKEKIKRGFEYLEHVVGQGIVPSRDKDDPASVAEVSLATCCAWFDFAGSPWRDNSPKLVAWFEKFSERDSVQRTKPDIDWKTGERVDLGFANSLVSKSGSS